jgi:hypothetical protein
MFEFTGCSFTGVSLRVRGLNQKQGLPMTFGRLALATVALAGFVSLSGPAPQAQPLVRIPDISSNSDITFAQYRPDNRRFGRPQRVCKWETVTKRVRGRIIKDRVQKCRIVRR